MSTRNKNKYPLKKIKNKTSSKIKEEEEVNKEISVIDLEISKTHIAEFFKMVEKGIRKHGVQKIASVLRNLDAQSEFTSKNLDILVKHICDCVVNEYRLEKVKTQD